MRGKVMGMLEDEGESGKTQSKQHQCFCLSMHCVCVCFSGQVVQQSKLSLHGCYLSSKIFRGNVGVVGSTQT